MMWQSRLQADLTISPTEAVIIDMALQALDNTDNEVINGLKSGIGEVVKSFERSLTPDAMKEIRAHAGILNVGDIIE